MANDFRTIITADNSQFVNSVNKAERSFSKFTNKCEKDADIVMFIHRPEYYDKNAERGYGELRIAKQRDGATGDIRFRYNNSLTKIFDYELQMPF